MLLRNIKWINYLDIHILDPKERNDFFKWLLLKIYDVQNYSNFYKKKSEYMPKINKIYYH
jgi:hypothetical protein